MTGSENVVPFPSADVWDGSGRPPEQLVEWTEQVAFTPFIAVGVDKLAGAEIYIVWQEVVQNVDTVLAPSRDVQVDPAGERVASHRHADRLPRT